MTVELFSSDRYKVHLYFDERALDERRYGILDTHDRDFTRHVVPLRNILAAQGYDQKHDFIRFSPFDCISRHIFALNDEGYPVGVISAIEVDCAKSDMQEQFRVGFDPGRTVMLARFAVMPDKHGKLSLVGPRMLNFVISSLRGCGYDYLFGEMSPPYCRPWDVASQCDITRYYLQIREFRLISAFAYDSVVPTAVVGAALSDLGRKRELEWQAAQPVEAARLSALEVRLRSKNPQVRRGAFSSICDSGLLGAAFTRDVV